MCHINIEIHSRHHSYALVLHHINFVCRFTAISTAYVCAGLCFACFVWTNVNLFITCRHIFVGTLLLFQFIRWSDVCWAKVTLLCFCHQALKRLAEKRTGLCECRRLRLCGSNESLCLHFHVLIYGAHANVYTPAHASTIPHLRWHSVVKAFGFLCASVFNEICCFFPLPCFLVIITNYVMLFISRWSIFRRFSAQHSTVHRMPWLYPLVYIRECLHLPRASCLRMFPEPRKCSTARRYFNVSIGKTDHGKKNNNGGSNTTEKMMLYLIRTQCASAKYGNGMRK